ncbi:hypothetical protein K438DRAFT_1771787 [Mycena galopus ATCC 62051]|nr:hypothetical protein K438DRAFT_1771787 [Mycena galopus ATCC 62051]
MSRSESVLHGTMNTCLLWNFLSPIQIPAALPKSIAIGTPVPIFNDDRARLIARGTILHVNGSFHTGKIRPDHTEEIINISATRCVVQITEVIIPAAILKIHKQSLASFSTVPFSAVCLRSHLRLTSTIVLPQISPPPNASSAATPSNENLIPLVPDRVTDGPISSLLTVTPEVSDLELKLDPSGFGALLHEEINTGVPHDRTAMQTYESDNQSQQIGEQILAASTLCAVVWFTFIRSRVLKDPFHIFNMFYISVQHGLRIEFARALRDAIFIPDAEDKSRIVAWGQRQNPPQSWDELLRKRPAWLLRRCKHIIPPPEQLHGDVAEVFRTFGSLKDANTGLPLFNHAAWAIAKNVLELIAKGYLSDPPGIPLYVELGTDKWGFTLFRNRRGTPFAEGDFIARHNLLVGTFNSTGKHYKGHYSPWQTNEVQELLSSLEDCLIDPILLTGWANGNLYEPTNEVAGVLPIPEDVHTKAGMAQFENSLHSKQPHHYLAALQGTRKPVLPIHSAPEKDLFRDLMVAHPTSFSSPKNIDNLVRLWNCHADEKKDIFYKQSKTMTAKARNELKLRLEAPTRGLAAPKVPVTQLTLHSVPSGMLPLFDEPPSQQDTLESSLSNNFAAPQVSYSGISSGSAAPSVIASTQFVAGSSSTYSENSGTSHLNDGISGVPAPIYRPPTS